MPDPTSLSAYSDIQEALLRALESEKGIRVRTPTPAAAIVMRRRIYSFRRLAREQDPNTPFNILVVELQANVVLIRKHIPEPLDIEEL